MASQSAPKLMLPLSATFKNIKQAFVNNSWIGASSTFDVLNPANSEVIAKVADCDASFADKAINAATQCYKGWCLNSTAKQREELLLKLNAKMLEHKDELARIITFEMGKPLPEAQGEIAYSASFFQWFAAEARRNDGRVLQPSVPGRQMFAMQEPVGVAAIITPWNFPSAMIVRKVGAAIAAGCPSVVKPAEDTPLSALAIAALFEEVGAPPGLLNIVPCSRIRATEVGKAFCSSEDVRALSFTGSTPVGKILLSQCASTVKKVGMELGGNAPFIVFPSANIDKAVTDALAGRFRCSGQTCICPNRFFVHKNVRAEFVSKLAAAVDKLNIGDGSASGTTVGPLINVRAVEKVDRLVKDAVSKGAKVVTGCQTALDKGFFYRPGVLDGVNSTMSIYHEEIFGPVASIIEFETEEQATEMANSSRVGLAGYFYSQDIAQVFRVARRLETGMVGVNEVLISGDSTPFGGVKESGLGREGGFTGLEEYTELKYVCLGSL